MKQRIIEDLLWLVECIGLLMMGWRPRRVLGRGDGRLWFWRNPLNGHLLERTLAYEVGVKQARIRR